MWIFKPEILNSNEPLKTRLPLSCWKQHWKLLSQAILEFHLAHREAECQEIRKQHHAHWGGRMGNGIWSKVSEGWNLQMKFWYWRAHCSLSLNSFLYLLWHAEWVLFVSNVPSFVNFLQWNQECYERAGEIPWVPGILLKVNKSI